MGHFVIENEQTVVFRDAHPLTRGHLHIAPRRHQKNFFRVPENEMLDMIEALWMARDWLQTEYNPAGYNIGINIGEAAGQSIPHANMHLIPRYGEEILDRPRGSRWLLGGQGSRRKTPSLQEILSHKEPLLENRYALLLEHPRPMLPGHALVVPRRTSVSFFDMREPERAAFWEAISESPSLLPVREADGYNVAIDVGPAAGQDQPFQAAHILPRQNGDASEAFGVRWMAGEHPDYQSRRLGN